MLVITTNYPERLDKALIRPGRIDMRLEFGRCTRDCLVDMYQHFFQTTIPESLDKDSLPDKKWTPAETIRVFLYHMRDPPQGLQYLITANPEEGLDIGALVHSREKNVQRNEGEDDINVDDDIDDDDIDFDDDEVVVDEVTDIAKLKHGDMTAKEAELYEYVHRIGRRGRVRNVSKTTSFYDAEKNNGFAGSLAKILKSNLADAASNASDDGNKSKEDDASAAIDDDDDCG